MSNKWYARPVLFVANIDRSVDFYRQQLDFTESWRYEEDGKAYFAQVPACSMPCAWSWKGAAWM
jgi:catechol 2,3-dioxygenase-like lactoylglutathione lyase family enzyme